MLLSIVKMLLFARPLSADEIELTLDIPTEPILIPPISVRGQVYVVAQLQVGSNKKGKRKPSYWSKNGATIQFKIAGEWTEKKDFFDSCARVDGFACPKEPMTYGPFISEPRAARVEFKDRINRKGKVARVESLYTGDLLLQAYTKKANWDRAKRVCTSALYENGKWMTAKNPVRQYQFPEKCPCITLGLRSQINLKLDTTSYKRGQKVAVGVYYECRREWKEWEINVPKETGIVKTMKRQILEYPSKLRVTDVRGDKPLMTDLEVKIVPNRQSPAERFFLRSGPKSTPWDLKDKFLADMTYSMMMRGRRLDLQEPGHVLEMIFDDDELDELEE